MDRDRRTGSPNQTSALRFLSYAIMALGDRAHARSRASAPLWISKALRNLQRDGMLMPAERARLAAAYAIAEDAAREEKTGKGDAIQG